VSVRSDAPADGFVPGRTLVTWTAEDAHGNRASATQVVEVAYGFGGVAPPLEDGGIYKASRTLPVRFSLSYADGQAVSTAVAGIQVIPLGADDTPGEPLDVQSNGAADGGGTFRYDGGFYHYNLSTAGMPPGAYRIVISVDYGTTHGVAIVLR